MKRVAASGGSLMISVITLGEIEFGHQITVTSDPERREEYLRWIRDNFPQSSIIDVTTAARIPYGDIKASLFRNYPPLNRDAN